MKCRAIILFLFFVLGLGGCRSAAEEPAPAPPSAVPAIEPLAVPRPDDDPDRNRAVAVTHAFYTWYTGEPHLSSLLESDYRHYLTPRLRQALAEHRGNFDPLLMAQERLRDFTVEPWYRHEAEAGVVVHFTIGESVHDLTIFLLPAEGEPAWQIDRIVPANLSTPDGVARRFYESYVGYYHVEGDPLADGHYRELEFLTPAFVEQVATLLAGGIDYDPILMAEVPPQSFRVDEVEHNGNEATVVLLRWWAGETAPCPLTVSLRRQDETWAIAGVDAPSIVPAPEEAPAPDVVVSTFFERYLAGGGFAAAAHEGSEHLHPIFVAGLAEQVQEWQAAGVDGQGYDPLLQSVIPGELPGALTVTVGSPQIYPGYGWAELQLWRHWPGMAGTLPLQLMLQQTPAGTWQIVEVSSVLPAAADGREEPGPPGGPVTSDPARLVAAIYTAALASGEPPEQAGARLQQLGLPLSAAEAFGFCAETVPLGISVDGSYIRPAAAGGVERASVVVHSSLEHHLFTAELARTGDEWQMTGVTCADSPAGRAHAFYSWYLGYVGDPSDYRLHNPFLDGAYADSPFLSAAFIREADELRAEGGVDPFLQALAAPASFAVEPGPTAGQATVHFDFGGDGGSREQTIIVHAAEVDGRWLLSGTEVATAADLTPPTAQVSVDTGEWSTYADAAYPFSFRIPAGWEVEARDLSELVPAEDPQKRIVMVYTAALAEARAAGAETTASGWPTGLPMVTASVVEGDAEVLAGTLPPAAETWEVLYNGYPVVVQREAGDYAATRYIFQHPRQAWWLVFEDYLSDFPGREAHAAEVEGILPGILSTLAFDE